VTEVSKAELAKEINRSAAIVTLLVNSGILDKCFTPDGKKLYLEKAITAIVHAKGSDYLDNTVEQTTPARVIKNVDIYNEESKEELQRFLDAEPSPSRQIEMIDKYWAGRIKRHNFLVANKEVLSIQDIKIVLDAIATPLAKALDELPFMLKSRFSIDDETFEWLQGHVNSIKLDFQDAV